MKLEAGTRVQDYILVERLGAGAFGEVWKAAHAHLPRVVAIKFATSQAAVAALGREGVSQFGLDHPGIVKVLDASLSASPPFVVLEYVDGKSLRQVLRERGRLEIPDVAAIFQQTAEALAYAHARGVVHGDVKPENILVARPLGDSPLPRVKLTDFHLGAFAAGVRPPLADGVRPSLETRAPIGTYHYLAPEQESGDAADGRADLYALGVVLFEMLTGRLPQGRDLPSDLEPSISWWWDHMFARCYTGLERRYRSAAEVLEDLAGARHGPRWGDMPSQRRAQAERVAGAAAPPAIAVAHLKAAARASRPSPGGPAAALAARGAATVRSGMSVAAALVALVSLLVPFGVLASVGAVQRVARPPRAPSAHAHPLGGPAGPAVSALPRERAWIGCGRSLDDLVGTYLRTERLLDAGEDVADEVAAIRAEAQRRGYRFWDAVRERKRVVIVFRGNEPTPLGEYSLGGGD